MADDDYTCEICCEKFILENMAKQPKLVPCCNHSFCLSCLTDIYSRNDNKFKCPYCRKISTRNPIEFKTNFKIFDRCLTCCHCQNKVLKDELFLCLDNGKMEIKCNTCNDNNDYKLVEYLPALINELKIYYDYYRANKDLDLINFLKEKIQKQIESFFADVIQKMTELISDKIISQLKVEANYDLEIKNNEFMRRLKQIDIDYKYLDDFYNDKQSRNFEAKKILEIMEFYDSNIDVFDREFKKVREFKDFIGHKNLFELKENLSKDDISVLLFENLETILSDFNGR